MSADMLFNNDMIYVWIYVCNVTPPHVPSFFATISDTPFRIIAIAPPASREWMPTLSMSKPLFTIPVYLTAFLTAFKICGAVICLTFHCRPNLAQYRHSGAYGSSLICRRRLISRARQATGLRSRWLFCRWSILPRTPIFWLSNMRVTPTSVKSVASPPSCPIFLAPFQNTTSFLLNWTVLVIRFLFIGNIYSPTRIRNINWSFTISSIVRDFSIPYCNLTEDTTSTGTANSGGGHRSSFF